MTSVAVDVGGTFTDVCVLDDESGDIRVAKVPSTKDPLEGVLAGVEEAGIDLSRSPTSTSAPATCSPGPRPAAAASATR